MLDATAMTLTYHRVNKAIGILLRALQTQIHWTSNKRHYICRAIADLNAWRRNPMPVYLVAARCNVSSAMHD